MYRRNNKVVSIGTVKIGKGHPVAIQSMLNINPLKIEENIKLALELQSMGCDILRVAVPNKESVKLISKLKENVLMPIVADIHFDYKLAIDSVLAGADKIRINPGNIGSKDHIKAVVKECVKKNVPIRVGVNAGSLEKDILNRYSSFSAEALCESAIKNINILENLDFNDIVVSVKSSNVVACIKAYELLASKCNYPFHLGITEAGNGSLAVVKSSIGIGSLLLKGIGDTIRVSLTDSPKKEIKCAKDILKSLGLIKNYGVEVVSCPTCGRTNTDLIKIVNKVKEKLAECTKNIRVAIMGCSVNGPGEAKSADIGVAMGKECGLIFKNGNILKRVPEANIVKALIDEIEKM